MTIASKFEHNRILEHGLSALRVLRGGLVLEGCRGDESVLHLEPLRVVLTRSTEIDLGVRGIHVPHDPLHRTAVFDVGRRSRGLKAELTQHLQHRSIGDVAVNHKFLVPKFQKDSVEQRFEGSHAFCTETFRDVGQPQRHPFRIGRPPIGVHHDGGEGMLPAHGRSAPP